MLKELVERNRSYRRFDESHEIDEATLKELVEMARLTASTANLQPLKYMISASPERNALIFPHLRWAGYLAEWPGPVEGEKPSAYIVILKDNSIFKAESCDHGIAAQTILLGAAEKGLGGCMIGNIDMKGLVTDLGIEEHLQVLLVLPLGKPVEEVRLVTVGSDGDMKYWRDEQGVHHVPKRSLEEIIIKQ
jgi:nitroreductase